MQATRYGLKMEAAYSPEMLVPF